MAQRKPYWRIQVSQELLWAVPVKIEQLKASLRAYVCAQDCMAALPTDNLPQEIIDMISGHVFDAYHHKFLQQWTIMYNCSTDDGTVAGLFGTLCRRVLEKKTTTELYRVAQSFCECHGYEPEDTRDRPYQLEGDDTPCKGPSQDIVEQSSRYYSEPRIRYALSGKWPDSEDYEDFTVDLDNAFDNLDPTSVFEETCESEVFWDLQDARSEIAAEWHDLINKGLLLSQREVAALKVLGVKHEIRIEYTARGIPVTSALLIPHAPTRINEDEGREHAWVHGQRFELMNMVVIPELPAAHRIALRRVLRLLRLQPCSRVNRQDADQSGEEVDWPQLVSLTNIKDVER